MNQITRLVVLLFLVMILFSQAKPSLDTKPGDEAVNQLIRIEQEWHQALEHNDVAKLDNLLAKDWIITNGSGVIITKSAVLSDLKSGDTKFISTVPSDIKVYVYNDAAIVTKISTDKTKYGNTPGGGRYQMTDMFVKLNGRWHCVATHSSHDLKL